MQAQCCDKQAGGHCRARKELKDVISTGELVADDVVIDLVKEKTLNQNMNKQDLLHEQTCISCIRDCIFTLLTVASMIPASGRTQKS